MHECLRSSIRPCGTVSACHTVTPSCSAGAAAAGSESRFGSAASSADVIAAVACSRVTWSGSRPGSALATRNAHSGLTLLVIDPLFT